MRLVVLLIVGWAMTGLVPGASAQGFGTSEGLYRWSFHLGDLDREAAFSMAEAESGWRPVTVPHDWSVGYSADESLASCTGWLPGGIGWYRTSLDIPASHADRRHYLYVEGAYNRSEIFVNGVSVGGRPNGYISFLEDITPHVKAGGTNIVTVRVDHSRAADSRWYTGSGLYRPVHLVSANPVHIGLWGVYCTAEAQADGSAVVSTETRTENHRDEVAEAEVVQELFDPAGQSVARAAEVCSIPAGGEAVVQVPLKVASPSLWNVETPNLYTLKTIVRLDGEVVDQTVTRTGIRTLRFDPDQGFALNGKWMKIKGVCLHHDAGVLGAAVPKAVWRLRLQTLKEMGCNGIRMSHNPQATSLYDLCDEMGFLVMDEAFDEWEHPKKKWIEGWNKGQPGFQGSADFFDEWGKRDLAAMVLRDRNHPSIIMWSIGNEVDYPNDPYSHPILDKAGIGQQHVQGYLKEQPHADRLGEIAQELAAVVRNKDPSRPVTAALAGAVMSNETDYPNALDVVGYNYTENRYEQDHKAYPDRVLYGSETGRDLRAWKAVRDNDYIFGQFIWTGFDYLGEARPWPSRGFSSGMVDLANFMKPHGWFRKALWSDEPTAYLGSYRIREHSNRISMDAPPVWAGSKGQRMRVVCYTNGEEAELLLNDRPVGDRKPYDPDTGIIHWDLDYEPGALKVKAFRSGEVFAANTLKTDGEPQVLQLLEEKSRPKLSKQYDVAVISMAAVDDAGNSVYSAEQLVTVQIKGPAELLGLENASGDAADNYLDDKQRLNHGRLVAYVRATADEGAVQVTCSAPGLKPLQLEMTIGE